MSKMLSFVLSMLLAHSASAGAGGIVIKGALKTWDEIAKIALKVGGKTVTDDAVKASAKTIEKAVAEHGDDVAVAAMRGGVEVAEQSLKHGGAFVRSLKVAGSCSDDAVKAVARNADNVVKWTAKYGDDVVELCGKAPGAFSRGIACVEKSGVENVGRTLKVVATHLPAEQIPQVFGAIERNPTVAKEFLDGVTKGGRYFVDKIFALNGKQIMTGTLGAAAIEGVVRQTAPAAAEGAAIEAQRKIATDLINRESPMTEDQRSLVNRWWGALLENRKMGLVACWSIGLVATVFAGAALLVFVKRKVRRRR